MRMGKRICKDRMGRYIFVISYVVEYTLVRTKEKQGFSKTQPV